MSANAFFASIPDPSAAWWSWALLPAAMVGGFWLPGRLAGCGRASPLPVVTEVLGSLLLLFGAVYACDLLRIPISLPTLLLWLVLAILLARRLIDGTRRPATQGPVVPNWQHWWREAWWWLPCAASFGSILWRGVMDPLSGWDNSWRWNHLAFLIRETGSLAYYPPTTAADFLLYPWCDGIPPLVAITNLWIYLGTGSTFGGLIVGRLVVELSLVLGLVWHLASREHGLRGAKFAVLALSASTIFAYSVALTQESGLTAAALLALAALLRDYSETPRASTASWAGAAAATCALLRDYNLLFLPLGLILLILARAPRRHVVLAATVMAACAGPWYARNAWMTENPLFAHELGGLFPVNEYHAYIMGEIRRTFAFGARIAVLPFVAAVAATGGLALVVAACAGLLLRGPSPSRRIILTLAGGMIALGILAMPSTAGGEIYGLRVVGPALALLAVCAGGLTLCTKRTGVVAAIALGLLALDASRRQWLFIFDPLCPPVKAWTKSSVGTKELSERFDRRALWRALANSSAGECILVDHPLFPVVGQQLGIALTPLQSPVAKTLTSTAEPAPASLEELAEALRAEHIRFVVLGADGQDYLGHPRLGLFARHPPVGIYEGLHIFDLRLIPPASTR